MTTRLRLTACALALLGGCAHPPAPEARRSPPPVVAAPAPAPAPESAPAPVAPPPPATTATASPAPAAPTEVQKPRRKAVRAPVVAPARIDLERVQLGMTPKQVTALLGAPTSRAVAGDKAAAPSRLGADGDRVELRYAGVGRLEFAGARAGAPDTARLVRIVPDSAEPIGR